MDSEESFETLELKNYGLKLFVALGAFNMGLFQFYFA